jgi:hypothetical protein
MRNDGVGCAQSCTVQDASKSPAVLLAPGNPLLIEFQRCFQLKFRFNLAFDFGPKIIDGGAERFVDLDLLADDFEGHDERVGGNRVGVSAPALVSPDGDAKVFRQGMGR